MIDLKLETETIIKHLKRGGIILYATDTVWGLGCDATNEEAIEKEMDDQDVYIEELESKLRDKGLKNEDYARCADLIELNKEKVKQYLIKMNFTKEDF